MVTEEAMGQTIATAQDAVGLLGCKCTLLAHVQFFIHKNMPPPRYRAIDNSLAMSIQTIPCPLLRPSIKSMSLHVQSEVVIVEESSPLLFGKHLGFSLKLRQALVNVCVSEERVSRVGAKQ
ncbi:hypothetical protein WISP_63355 [Willisornis vidua]|uniref:Uncharacterized protein n=1 Tax=Willisornis vidua TaxID=1566151 RepID=A0ABQ9DFJ8_9PASS|nr:hypothetical protein WISP_63355 [Willisornis vidua]